MKPNDVAVQREKVRNKPGILPLYTEMLSYPYYFMSLPECTSSHPVTLVDLYHDFPNCSALFHVLVSLSNILKRENLV